MVFDIYSTVTKQKLTLPGLTEIFPRGRRPFVKVSGLDYGSNYELLETTFQVRYYYFDLVEL